MLSPAAASARISAIAAARGVAGVGADRSAFGPRVGNPKQPDIAAHKTTAGIRPARNGAARFRFEFILSPSTIPGGAGTPVLRCL